MLFSLVLFCFVLFVLFCGLSKRMFFFFLVFVLFCLFCFCFCFCFVLFCFVLFCFILFLGGGRSYALFVLSCHALSYLFLSFFLSFCCCCMRVFWLVGFFFVLVFLVFAFFFVSVFI